MAGCLGACALGYILFKAFGKDRADFLDAKKVLADHGCTIKESFFGDSLEVTGPQFLKYSATIGQNFDCLKKHFDTVGSLPKYIFSRFSAGAMALAGGLGVAFNADRIVNAATHERTHKRLVTFCDYLKN